LRFLPLQRLPACDALLPEAAMLRVIPLQLWRHPLNPRDRGPDRSMTLPLRFFALRCDAVKLDERICRLLFARSKTRCVNAAANET
jgi:hypothetical protein